MLMRSGISFQTKNNIITRNRNGRKGGGLAFIFRADLKVKQSELDVYESFEHCIVDINATSPNFKLILVYRPPSKSVQMFISDLNELLESHSLSGPPLLISGDMNINLLNDSAETSKYRDVLDSFSLVQHVRDSTHIKGGLLDHVISKEESALRISNVDVSDLISDHHMVSCHISVRLLKQHVRTVSFRKISDINVDDFKMDIKGTNIYKNHLTMELNDLVNGYDHELKQLLDLHAPLVTRQLTTRRREPRSIVFQHWLLTRFLDERSNECLLENCRHFCIYQ